MVKYQFEIEDDVWEKWKEALPNDLTVKEGVRAEFHGRTATPPEYREKAFENHGESCGVCEEEDATIVHHINGNKYDNDVENLLPVCNSCHGKIHAGNAGELSEALPKWSIRHRHSGEGPKTHTTISLSEETKERFDELRPSGAASADEFLSALLEYYEDGTAPSYADSNAGVPDEVKEQLDRIEAAAKEATQTAQDTQHTLEGLQ
jgi:hypothetical protein